MRCYKTAFEWAGLDVLCLSRLNNVNEKLCELPKLKALTDSVKTRVTSLQRALTHQLSGCNRNQIPFTLQIQCGHVQHKLPPQVFWVTYRNPFTPARSDQITRDGFLNRASSAVSDSPVSWCLFP